MSSQRRSSTNAPTLSEEHASIRVQVVIAFMLSRTASCKSPVPSIIDRFIVENDLCAAGTRQKGRIHHCETGSFGKTATSPDHPSSGGYNAWASRRCHHHYYHPRRQDPPSLPHSSFAPVACIRDTSSGDEVLWCTLKRRKPPLREPSTTRESLALAQ